MIFLSNFHIILSIPSVVFFIIGIIGLLISNDTLKRLGFTVAGAFFIYYCVLIVIQFMFNI